MSGLVIGSDMIRVDDGQRGTVATLNGELRITYLDHGEMVVAPKSEKWVVEAQPRHPMRAEEKLEIALWADKALRAIELHEPMRHWEKPSLSDEPYDAGLVLAIVAYLSGRE